MSKKIIIPLVSIVFLFIIVFASWFLWYIKPYKPLRIYILDKTVPTIDRREHKSFSWILNHNNYIKKDGTRYNVKEDYYGFFPINLKANEFDFKSIRIHEIEDIASAYDMCYYTDTYGVYYNEWYCQNAQGEQPVTNKVYGGLNQDDYLLLKKMRDQKKLIITEFNFYNAPTNALIREKLEDLFGLNWSGWTGKYFSSLDTLKNEDFPAWIVRIYKEQNNNQWPFKNDGIVLVHKFGTLAILESETHLTSGKPLIHSNPETTKKYGVPKSIEYLNWFDITFSTEQNNILANFQFNVNEKGDSLLRSYNLQPVFPAIIEHSNDYMFYYFGGDFADNNVTMSSAYFEGYHQFVSMFSSIGKNNSMEFYWKYYNPLMTKILDDYYASIKK